MKAKNEDLDLESPLYRPFFPKIWERVSLYSLANWLNGMAFRDFEFTDTGKPIIKIAEIKNGISGQTKFTQANYDNAYYIKSGDMLFAWSGQPETSIDVYWWRGPEGWLNQHIFKVTPDPKCDLIFFFYLLKYLKPNFIAIARNKQTTGLGHVTVKDLSNLLVGIPNKEEQRAIAGVLGALDDKIELNRRMNRTLEAMARAVFREMMNASRESGRMKVGTVGEDFNLTMGQSPPGETYNEKGEGVPFFQGRADFGFRYPENRVYCTAPTRFAKAGDTLVSVRAPVGDVNMAWEDCAIGRGVAAVRHKTGSRSYTYYAMKSLEEDFKRFEAEGTVFGSINKADFQNLEILIPTSEQVEKFEEFCYPIDQMIENNEKESRTLARLRDALLPRLMRGEVRVTVHE